MLLKTTSWEPENLLAIFERFPFAVLYYNTGLIKMQLQLFYAATNQKYKIYAFMVEQRGNTGLRLNKLCKMSLCQFGQQRRRV